MSDHKSVITFYQLKHDAEANTSLDALNETCELISLLRQILLYIPFSQGLGHCACMARLASLFS